MSEPVQLPVRDTAYDIALANPDAFLSGFLTWLAENYHVWTAFNREANRIWNRGRRHYSARTIGEVLRHHSALAENNSEWKLNNVIFPDLARLYLLVHPERADFFELRAKSKSRRAA